MSIHIMRPSYIVQQTVTPPPPAAVGRPFGCTGLWKDTITRQPDTDVFTMGRDSVTPSSLLARISAAQTQNKKLCLGLTGGAHCFNYAAGCPASGTSADKFDLPTWKLRMDAYNTPSLVNAVAAGVADGTILGADMLDEPFHSTWGGVFTKTLLDQMATYLRGIFPTLPAGLELTLPWWNDGSNGQPNQTFAVVDFVICQYEFDQVADFYRQPVTAFRDNATALGVREGVKIVHSIAYMDGGNRTAGCPLSTTGGVGSFGTNCRMTPAQIQTAADVLAPASVGLLLWRYDDTGVPGSTNMQLPAAKTTFANIAAQQALLTQLSWMRGVSP